MKKVLLVLLAVTAFSCGEKESDLKDGKGDLVEISYMDSRLNNVTEKVFLPMKNIGEEYNLLMENGWTTEDYKRVIKDAIEFSDYYVKNPRTYYVEAVYTSAFDGRMFIRVSGYAKNGFGVESNVSFQIEVDVKNKKIIKKY